MPSNHPLHLHSPTPFGSVMLGRDFRGKKYRFGFNGKEKNSELNSDNYAFEARIYDGRIGRWLSVDPLEMKFPNLSPYLNSENNPLYFMDNDGREPNRSQAANWTQIKAVLTNYFNISKNNQSLDKLKYTEGDAGGAAVGPFGGPEGLRYIYTEKYGWIDFGHFFQVAAGMENKANSTSFGKGGHWFIKNSIGAYMVATIALWDKTKEVEYAQDKNSDTYWSYEDGPSNLAGLDFWFKYYDNDGNLVEKLEDFFKDAEAKEPFEAPNYAIMQDKPQDCRWFEQNISMAKLNEPKPTLENKKAHPDAKPQTKSKNQSAK